MHGVPFFPHLQAEEAVPIVLEQPAICLTVQGAKWAVAGEERLVYKAGHALAVTVATPARSAVAAATLERPNLGLTIRLDLTKLRDVAQDACFQKSSRKGRPSQRAFVLEVESEVLDCCLRGLRLLKTPEAIPILFPGIMVKSASGSCAVLNVSNLS